MMTRLRQKRTQQDTACYPTVASKAPRFCCPLPKPLHSSLTSALPDPGAEQPASGLPPSPPPAPPDSVSLRGLFSLLRPLSVQVCFLDSPHHLPLLHPRQPICFLHPEASLSLRPPGPHWPGPPHHLQSPASCRGCSEDHCLPSEMPAALPVLLPQLSGTFKLLSALPGAVPELGQLLGLLQQPAWAPLPPFLHPGAGLPPLLHCGAASPLLLVLLAGPQPLLLHHRPARGARPPRRVPPVRAVRRPPHHPQAGLVAPAAPLLHPRAHPALLLHDRTHAPLLLHAELQPAKLLRAPAKNPDPLRLLLRQRRAKPAALLLRAPPGTPRWHCPAHSPAPQRPRGPAPPDGAALRARLQRPPPASFRPVPRGGGCGAAFSPAQLPRPGPGPQP
uniref:Activated CDC42 kinase 1 isoform X31 n=1 Tax=Sus scrofa TaxID=9823 RepID=A0A480F0M7_PIG